MTIANWIFLGLIILALGLWLISIIKHKIILQKVCECLILPLSATLIIMRLTKSLPDSFHIIEITAIAFSFISISAVFLAFEKIYTLRVAGRIASLINLLCWSLLYEPIFRIHAVPVWLWILCSCVYGAAIIVSCALSGKQRILFYLTFAVSFAIAAFLHFCALIFLCYERTTASVMLFGGASLAAGLVVFHFINLTRLNIKHAGVIRYSLLVVSQILIACSNILLIH